MNQLIKRSFLLLSIAATCGCSALANLDPNTLNAGDVAAGNPLPGGTGISNDIYNASEAIKGLSLSDADAKKMADEFIAQSDAENKLAPASSIYAQRLNKLVKRHINEDGMNLDFKVYLAPDINAFALANGSVRVYSGLMDQMKDEEVLSVIGHEIGHVKLGHSKSQMQKAAVTSAGVNSATGRLNAKVGGNAAGLAGAGIAAAGEGLKDILGAQFSRSDEKSADDYSLAFLQRNKYDPQAIIHALQKLAAIAGGEQEKGLAFLTSSHPDPLDRAERLAKQLGVQLDSQPQVMQIAAQEPAEDEEEQVLRITPKKTQDKPKKTIVTAKIGPVSSTSAGTWRAPPVHINEAPAGWFIQLASLTDPQLAKQMVQDLSRGGATGQIHSTKESGVKFFQVLVGPYNSRGSADEDMERIRSLALHESEPFVINIDNRPAVKLTRKRRS